MLVIPDTNILISRDEFQLIDHLYNRESGGLVFNAKLDERLITNAIAIHKGRISYLSSHEVLVLPEVKDQVKFHRKRIADNLSKRDYLHSFASLNGRVGSRTLEHEARNYALLQEWHALFDEKLSWKNVPFDVPLAVDGFLDKFCKHYHLNNRQKPDRNTDHRLFAVTIAESLRSKGDTQLLTYDRELARHIGLLHEAALVMYSAHRDPLLADRLPKVNLWSDEKQRPVPWEFSHLKKDLCSHEGMIPEKMDTSEQRRQYAGAISRGVVLLTDGLQTLSRHITPR